MTRMLAKNATYLTLASTGQKVVAFLYFLFLARVMQPENTGAYFLALSITIIFSVIADFGITSVVIREIAKARGDAVRLIRGALFLKVPLIILGGVGAYLTGFFLNYDAVILHLIVYSIVVLLFDAISLLFYGILRGCQSLQYESLGIFVGQIISASVGGLVLIFEPRLSFLIFALMLGSGWNMIFSAFQIYRKFGRSVFLPMFDHTLLRPLLTMTVPFALAAIFVKIYSYVDSIFISKFLDTEAVGIYSIAYKYTYAFQFLPLAFVAALYPTFSSQMAGDQTALKQTFDSSIWYMLILSVPIAFGLWAVAPEAVQLAGSEYAASAIVLQSLVFVLIPIFLDFPVGSLLNAADRQSTKTWLMGITMVINIILNALFIPQFGIVGAAYAALVSFSFLFLSSFAFVSSLIAGVTWGRLIKIALPIITSGVVMCLVVVVLKPLIGFIPVIVVGAIVYLIMLFLTGSLRKETIVSYVTSTTRHS